MLNLIIGTLELNQFGPLIPPVVIVTNCTRVSTFSDPLMLTDLEHDVVFALMLRNVDDGVEFVHHLELYRVHVGFR